LATVVEAPAQALGGWPLVGRALRSAWWIWLLPAAMVVALAVRSIVALDYVHIAGGLLWTGTDLFMGLVVAPVMRRLAPPARRAVTEHLLPRMLFYMPVVALATTTSGYYLSRWTGIGQSGPGHAWFVAAVVITLLMFVQGIGILLPTNLAMYLESARPNPDVEKIRRTMVRYMRMVAWQGVCQLAIIFVMVRLVVG
jgi:hypothetical protein